MMKTILQINIVGNFGSTGRIAENIGQLAIADGWQSYIAFGRYERESQSELIKIGTNTELYYHIIKTRIFDKHGFGSKHATKELIKKIKKIQPDIIHLHNLHGYYLNIQVLFEYLAKINIPIVWTIHDCWAFTGHCAYFDYINCEKWKSQCYECPQKKAYPASYFFDSSFNNFVQKKQLFDAISNLNLVPVSMWLSNLLKESFLGNKKIITIYNGIDTDIFTPRNGTDIKNKYNLNNKHIILGVANIWSKRKGYDDFIKLSTAIDEQYHIVLVGLNEKQIEKLPANITGIKCTENLNELAELYSIADVYFNPTWEDNFPTTNLEALSCGTPVITYNTGGSIESVSKETGYIAEKGDWQSVYKMIKEIKGKSKNQYSNMCRKRAVECYEKKQQYYKYIQLYESLLH